MAPEVATLDEISREFGGHARARAADPDGGARSVLRATARVGGARPRRAALAGGSDRRRRRSSAGPGSTSTARSSVADERLRSPAASPGAVRNGTPRRDSAIAENAITELRPAAGSRARRRRSAPRGHARQAARDRGAQFSRSRASSGAPARARDAGESGDARPRRYSSDRPRSPRLPGREAVERPSRHSSRWRSRLKPTTSRRHAWLTASNDELAFEPPGVQAREQRHWLVGPTAPRRPISMREGATGRGRVDAPPAPSTSTSVHACASDWRTIR